LSSGFA